MVLFSGCTTQDLSKEHRDSLQKLRQKLDEMNPEPVIEHLCKNKALSPMQELRIKDKSKTEKNTTLLKILEQQKDWVYHCLVDGLKRSGQDQVLNILGECKFVHTITVLYCVNICNNT